jgi:signal peptidase II
MSATSTPRMRLALRLALWLLLAACIVVLDQLSKNAILARFVLHESVIVTDFFNLVLVFNRGAAFSFLSDAGGWQKWLFVALAGGICTWLFVMLRQCAHERLLPTAIAFIMGGAIGNVIDRLRFDAVVDFLDFHAMGWHWPAFNLADSAIFVGVGLMLLHQFRYENRTHD